jgi:hypothetical protein
VALTAHPLPSNAEVKEKVELYHYSMSGPSWLVLGVNFTFFTLIIVSKCYLKFSPVPNPCLGAPSNFTGKLYQFFF